MTPGTDPKVVATRPSRVTRGPTSSRPSSAHPLANGLSILISRPAGPAARSAPARLPQRRGRRAGGRGRGDGPVGARPDRGHRAHDAIALVEAPSGSGRRSTPTRAGTPIPRASRCPASRLEPALDLLAEVVAHPTFPEEEVERIRDERLNDLLQARADARRRADEAFAATIYAPIVAVPPAIGRHQGDGRALDPVGARARLHARPRPEPDDAGPGRRLRRARGRPASPTA